MRTLAWTNATVAFGLELAALAVLGWGGWQLGGSPLPGMLLAVALPAAAAALWGLFAAPRAPHRSPARRYATQVLVLGGAAVLLAGTGSPGWGAVFAAVVLVNVVAAAVLPAVEPRTA